MLAFCNRIGRCDFLKRHGRFHYLVKLMDILGRNKLEITKIVYGVGIDIWEAACNDHLSLGRFPGNSLFNGPKGILLVSRDNAAGGNDDQISPPGIGCCLPLIGLEVFLDKYAVQAAANATCIKHITSFHYPTKNPRVTINAPDGVGSRAGFSSREKLAADRIGENTYRLNGLLLPHQHIVIRWWNKTAADAWKPEVQ